MGTLIATYAVALAGMSAYAAWLAIGARRLTRRLEQLEALAEGSPDNLHRPRALLDNAA